VCSVIFGLNSAAFCSESSILVSFPFMLIFVYCLGSDLDPIWARFSADYFFWRDAFLAI